MEGSKATRSRAQQRKKSRLRLGLHRGKPLNPYNLTRIRSFLELQTKSKLVSFLLDAALSDPEIRVRVRSIAASNESRCEILVRGLGADSTDETLTEAFSPFGQIEDCSVVRDEMTGRPKGHGFVVYKTRSGAANALKEPKKTFKNRTIWCQLASVGPARPDDSVSSSIARAHRQNLVPLVERPVFVDVAMNRGLVNVAALGGVTRLDYGGGVIRAPYGEVGYGREAMRFPYGGGMIGVPYGGEPMRLSHGRGVGGMPYGVGGMPYGGGRMSG